MKIVYYYILYLKPKDDSGINEIHLKGFTTKAGAEAYKLKCDQYFKTRFIYSKIKKVDLSKYEGEIWL